MTTTSTAPAAPGATAATEPVRRRAGFGSALRWELRKLRKQTRTRAVLALALIAPIPVVLVIDGQSRPPKDTLFGRFATDNGFALALLILGFAAQWVLPLLTAIVAGDVFASEDQHGTWKTVLTRSTSRGRIFWAKVTTAGLFTVVMLALFAASTIAASLLIVGHQPLTGLTGQTISPTGSLELVVASWASVLAPTLGFACVAILLSIWSRNPAVGIAAPVVIAMVMQLVGALGGVEALRPFLLTTAFESWHGLLSAPRFYGPLVTGLVASAVWGAVTLLVSFSLLRRRDITGG